MEELLFQKKLLYIIKMTLSKVFYKIIVLLASHVFSVRGRVVCSDCSTYNNNNNNLLK